jgi:hypothetical protein
MSSFKQLSKSDVSFTPYRANKQWDIVHSYSGSTAYLDAWSTQNTLLDFRHSLAGVGTQDAALAFGGLGSNVAMACTEEYDGTSWSRKSPLSTGRRIIKGAGSQNAALAFGGIMPNVFTKCTEEYNGTSWASANDLNNVIGNGSGMGTQNAALSAGGQAPAITAQTEEYDGTSWTVGGNLITARYALAGGGTQNAAVVFGGVGIGLPVVTCTEEYDGSTWASGGCLLNAHDTFGGFGTQTAALAAFGTIQPSNFIIRCAQAYDGTTWSYRSSVINGRQSVGTAGNQNAALAFGGQGGSDQPAFNFRNFTEEYNVTPITIPSTSCVAIYKGTNVTGSFDTNTDPATEGKYERLVYSQINQLYYQDYTATLNTSSLANSVYYESASVQRPTSSYFVYNDNPSLIDYYPTGANEGVRVISVNPSLYSNKILPNNFRISASNYDIKDDGYGNLFDYSSSITHVGNIFYAQGISVITNQDYQSIFPLPVLTKNDEVSFLSGDDPKLIYPLSNDDPRGGTIVSESIMLYGDTNSTNAKWGANIDGSVSLTSTTPGTYSIYYTVNSYIEQYEAYLVSNRAKITATII